jgi:hypothetical protein
MSVNFSMSDDQSFQSKIANFPIGPIGRIGPIHGRPQRELKVLWVLSQFPSRFLELLVATNPSIYLTYNEISTHRTDHIPQLLRCFTHQDLEYLTIFTKADSGSNNEFKSWCECALHDIVHFGENALWTEHNLGDFMCMLNGLGRSYQFEWLSESPLRSDDFQGIVLEEHWRSSEYSEIYIVRC